MSEDLDDGSECLSDSNENLVGDDGDTDADPDNNIRDDRNSIGNQQVFVIQFRYMMYVKSELSRF